MSGEATPRLLIFVIAYQAESTLRGVLERIPREVFRAYECEVLVVDDASEDRTAEIGREYQAHHPDIPLTILRNSFNQGYGGNQKVGYAYAIAEGFDYVAMVHGDGQYAPEELPRLLEPLRAGQADAVFGSRMMRRGSALRGGMPLYKYVGNRILTIMQNRLLGTDLTEFHSGYRIYAVPALDGLHYRLNANGFHFDTEIIIQLLNAGMRIVELEIPTYYGDEISRVNGLAYAWHVTTTTIANTLHRAGLLHQRRFDSRTIGNSHYDLKLGYPSSHSWALAAVPDGASVLDMGSGPGGLANELLDKGCDVAVVDMYPPAQADPRITVHLQDLDDPIAFDVGDRDFLLLLDVIEHLKDPERFLDRLRAKFDYRPRTLILTTGNIAFIVQRLMLLFGQFNYGKAGILDRTHTRLFTFRSMQHLLRDAGFRIRKVRGVPAPFPKVFGDGVVGRLLVAINQALIAFSKSIFAYQIYIEATTTPDTDFVLKDARHQSRGASESSGSELAASQRNAAPIARK